MRLSTMLMLGGASICALIATSLTASLFTADRPKPAPVAAPVAPPAPQARKIVVAARALPFGAPVTPDALKEVPWPNDYSLPGTYASASSLALEKRTVLSAIGENEPIIESRLSAPGQHATFSALIRQGYTAVTVRVDDVLGVAGLVQPGDHVNVLLTQNQGAAGGPKGDAYSATLLQNVRVLAVDQSIDRARQAKPARAVTIEVSLEQAQKLTLAASVGQLSLALRGAGATGHVESRRIELSDLPRRPDPPAAPVTEVAPPPAAPVAAPAAPAEDPGPSIAVTRGVDRTVYEVLVDGHSDVRRVAAIRRDQAAGSPEREAHPAVVSRPGRDAPGKPIGEIDAREAVTPR